MKRLSAISVMVFSFFAAASIESEARDANKDVKRKVQQGEMQFDAAGFPAGAQKADKADGQQNTAMLFCGDVNGIYQKSASARGREFAAPDGAHKVYVTVEATVRKDSSSGQNDCFNQTTLLAQKDPGGPFESVFSYAGGKDAGSGNGIQLIDWSVDSTVLVADLITWWYYSEGWEHTILVYTPGTQGVRKKPLKELFSAAVHKGVWGRGATSRILA